MAVEPDLSKLKICFLAGTLGQGGAERQLYYIIRELRNSARQVRVFCLTRGEYWEEKICALGVPVIWVGQSSSRLLRLARICSELLKDPPEIVQSQHFYTNLYVTAAARLLGLREIGAIRNNVWSEVHQNGAFLGPLSLRMPRVIAANSNAAIRTIVAHGIALQRVCLLNNVVDIEQFRPPEERRATVFRVLAVGRLCEQKRYDRLLEVIAELRKCSSRAVKTVLVGDGPLRPELERRAGQLRLLPDAVKFHGADDNLLPFYNNADVLLLTSDYEGTPNVVLEAMACGLPVVATRVGGIAEIVQEGVTGLLAQPGSTEELVEALLKIAGNENMRNQFGANARAYTEDHYSPERLADHLRRLYAAALS
jgi:glycosyltransferase involved in cell wall biosynthesis